MRFRLLVLALAVGLVVVGVVRAQETRVEALPEFGPTVVEVQTEALGLSADEVEQLITVPLEQDLLVGVPFLAEMESVSLPGLSSVTMRFEDGTDMLAARQVVQERLTQAVGAAGLPAVADTPQMIQPHSSSSRAAIIRATADELSLMEMSVLARWVVGPRLLGVDGVANVSIWGHRDRQLQVLVDPEQLRRDGVRLAQVIRTAGNSLEVSPLSYLEASKPGTGGFIDTANQRLNIFHEQAITSAEELAAVPLEGPSELDSQGRPVLLGDVTTVVEDHQPLIGDAVCPQQQCLLLVVEKFPGATNSEIAAGLSGALTALTPGLAGMQLDASVYDPAEYVASATSTTGWALLVGLILLMLLVLLFHWSWRSSVVVAASVVASVTAAYVVLNLRGDPINLMVVAGLVLALTALIDDAVDDVHEIAARVHHFRRTGTSGAVWPTVLDAAVELRRTALFAVLLVGAATIPLFFLDGPAGAFLPPIAVSYLLAVGASVLVALTVTPAFALLMLSSGPLPRSSSPVVGRLQQGFDRALPQVVARSRAVLAVTAVVALAGLAAIPLTGWSMDPEVRERHLVVQLEAEPGSSLPRMTETVTRAVEDIGALPSVLGVNGQVGRAVMSDQTVDVDRAEVWVALDPEADYSVAVQSVEDAAAALPQVRTQVLTYSGDRVERILTEEASDVSVRIYGEDPTTLSDTAEDVRAAVADVDGVSDVTVGAVPEESTLQVEVDLGSAQGFGIKPGDVRRAASVLVGGITVGNLFEEQKVFDVVVWGDPSVRQTPTDLQNLPIDRPGGGSVRLGEVAEVREVTTPAMIRHDSVSRFVEVGGTITGGSASDVVDGVRAAVDRVAFPLDHHAEVFSAALDRRDAIIQLLTIVLAALVAVFLLLQAAFRSWRMATVGLAALPAALSGALLAALAMGTAGLGTAGALLAVAGLGFRLVVRVLHHLLRLQRLRRTSRAETVLSGTRDRVAPTLLTVLGSAAILLPFAVLPGAAGLELLQPAAVVALAGLLTTTVVALFVVPTAFVLFAPNEDSEAWADGLYEDLVPASAPVPQPSVRA